MSLELNITIFWLGLLIVLLLIEAATMGLTTIWFAGGALVSFFAALFWVPLAVQIVLFLSPILVVEGAIDKRFDREVNRREQ